MNEGLNMALTQAEKQKRYRNKKSNAPVTETPGNAPIVTHGNAQPVRAKW